METEYRTESRMIAEQIKAITGSSLIKINHQASEYIIMGICENQIEALKYMLGLVQSTHLIAAAPELLEAAEALLIDLEPEFGCFDGFGKRDQDNTRLFYQRPEIKLLVKAIAKARGDS